jgi:hypothetical protein
MFVCDFVCVCPCKIDLTGLTFVKFYNDNQKQFFFISFMLFSYNFMGALITYTLGYLIIIQNCFYNFNAILGFAFY